MKRGPLNQIMWDISAHDAKVAAVRASKVVTIGDLRAHHNARKALVRKLLAKQPGQP